jgi:hypothetical protein
MELSIISGSNYDHAIKLSKTLAESKIVPLMFQGKPADIFATLALGAELGFKPMASLNSIVVIQGQATLKAQTQLALARSRLPELKVAIKTNEIDFVEVTISNKGESYTALWNDQKATAMGLIGKDNYRKQKITMYRWRAISEALRVICPDVLQGLMAYEEFIDVDGKEIETRSAKDLLEQDYPIPENEKEIGSPDYRVQQGKFRGKQLKEIDHLDIDARIEYLEAKEKKEPLKEYYKEELRSMLIYLQNLETAVIE